MNPAGRRLLALYRRALRLYPRSFQKEYAEELAAVFALRLQGNRADVKTALRELRDLPLALAAAFLRERRQQQMKRSLDNWFSNTSGSWWEVLLAALPFLLMGFLPGLFSIIPAVNNLPPLAGMLILGTLFLILAALGIIGLLVSLPRWSLTYAGISLTLFALSMIISPNLLWDFEVPSGWPSWGLNAVLMGVFLIVLALSTWILLWSAGRIRLMKPFAANLKSDRSLVSFMMFGGAYVLVVLHYEDLADGGVYLIASSLVMAAGAWLYLRAKNLPAKLWALVVAVTLGEGIALAANLILFPYPAWEVELGSVHFPAAVMFVLISWLTSLVMVLLPMAIPWYGTPLNETIAT